MKKLAFCLSFVLLAVFSSYSQSAERNVSSEKATVEQKAHQAVEKLVSKLDLNESQQAKAYPIALEFFKLKASLANLKSTDVKAYKEQIKAAGQKEMDKLNAILNKVQQTKLQEMIKERKAEKAGRD